MSVEDLITLARKLRPMIEKAAESLSDQELSGAPELLPKLRQNGGFIPAGTHVNWYGTVKRAAADLWDKKQYAPDEAPELWEDIAYYRGNRVIPPIITAGLAFSQGEKGWWCGILYESMLDQNVWTPEQNSNGWRKFEEDGKTERAQ